MTIPTAQKPIPKTPEPHEGEIRLEPHSSSFYTATGSIPSSSNGSFTQDENSEEPDTTPYSNSADDPDPLPETATEEEMKERAIQLREYGLELLETYKRSKWMGKEMWIEFITSFRPHTIRT